MKKQEKDTLAIEEKDNETGINEAEQGKKQSKVNDKRKEFLQFVKFLAFSLSAGFIQIITFELLYTWTEWLTWWPSYLISVILSVIWNFTFNRKFTFKSASNVPLAMAIVTLYYCAYIPASVFGGEALEGIGWNGTLVTLLMMVINFITEFFWDKYIVFNDKLLNKIFKKKASVDNIAEKKLLEYSGEIQEEEVDNE